VLLGAGVDEVDLEVGERVRLRVGDGAAAGQVPVVDVVRANVLERAEGAGYRGEVIRVRRKGGALED